MVLQAGSTENLTPRTMYETARGKSSTLSLMVILLWLEMLTFLGEIKIGWWQKNLVYPYKQILNDFPPSVFLSRSAGIFTSQSKRHHYTHSPRHWAVAAVLKIWEWSIAQSLNLKSADFRRLNEFMEIGTLNASYSIHRIYPIDFSNTSSHFSNVSSSCLAGFSLSVR